MAIKLTGEDPLLGDHIYQQLREMIFTREIHPGQALSVPKLAGQLNVSRSPVREAVQQLINEGLAVHVPYAGARVQKLDAEAVRQVFSVREVLDGLAARHAALIITRERLGELDVVVSEQRELLVMPPEGHRDSQLDLRFHSLIRDSANNEPLRASLARLEALAHLYSSDMWNLDDNRRVAVEEHERILAALRAGDQTAAGDAAEAHVRAVLVRMSRDTLEWMHSPRN
ncbi:GntR family transcriptional regulator [Subtercola frigoramans]|uniref:DNA-binding GntR family transcriptional regulator n=1 Tax=Subtercola frigoramans TaxID=120298 RepID=A0ABS2L219_9MICO|nr:GntR family transcriptional regulator [Subtercola frigoramans]MBM7471120.1 DNA-binding GntR family transcriptional regulator [Subtercola frigoramans]